MISCDKSGSDANSIADLQHTFENGSSGDTSLEIFTLLTGFVDVEGSNDDHLRGTCEVSHRDGYAA